jgi:DNA invertase Pin-like site-specific DNA recombinase
MRIGYARVSTLDQNLDFQLEKLKETGCEKVTKKASGPQTGRSELNRVLYDMLREGGTVAVWKLDRLARSQKQLIETANLSGTNYLLRTLYCKWLGLLFI